VRQAILQRRKVRIEYTDSAQHMSNRVVHPLALYFWGSAWSVAAWCESRKDFRNFRLDRIRSLEIEAETFEDTPGQEFRDFIRRPSEKSEGR
jgi:predicted DNA-binding transcriptional regulator YafY